MAEEENTLGGSFDAQQEAAPEQQETQTPTGFVDNSESYRAFVDSLPEELKSSQTIQQTQDFKSLAGQLINAQGALGKKRIEAPQPDWTEEQYKEYYNHVRPENDEYTIPDEFKFTQDDERFQNVELEQLGDEDTQELVDFAGAIGLNQQQFNALYERFVQYNEEGKLMEGDNLNQSIQDSKLALQAEWGNDFEMNVRNGRETFDVLSKDIPELNDLISDPAVANHPGVLKLFNKLAPMVRDSAPVLTNGVPSAFAADNVASIKGEIERIDTENSELMFSNPSTMSMADRAKRDKLLEKRTNLYTKLYGQG
jgi:hypothetical protein